MLVECCISTVVFAVLSCGLQRIFLKLTSGILLGKIQGVWTGEEKKSNMLELDRGYLASGPVESATGLVFPLTYLLLTSTEALLLASRS